MSGEDELELEFEDDIDDKEVIMCVKANPFLYNKSEKMYSNNEMKKMAWNTIGDSLTNKKSGAEVEHRFFQLRQRFGRERRKVIQSAPRSGAGASQATYTPQWSLYNELMFLADVIKPRNRTTSNYTKKHSISQTIQVNLPTSLPSTSTSKSSSISNLWNKELIDDASECSSISESSLSSHSAQQSLASSFSTFDCGISPVKQMRETINTYGKRVPESGNFSKRKKQNLDAFNKSIFEQSKTLSTLAQKVGDALSCDQPSPSHATDPSSSLRPDVKAMLTTIGFVMQKLPESKHLDLLITIMQFVKQYTESNITT